MKIGIPNEISDGERRVAIVPKTASQLLKDGHEVFIETGAGEKAYFPDAEYEQAGAVIVKDKQLLYSGADVIMKIQSSSKRGNRDDEKRFNLYWLSFFCFKC